MRVKRSKAKGARAEVLRRVRDLEEQMCMLTWQDRLRQAFERITDLEERLEQLSK